MALEKAGGKDPTTAAGKSGNKETEEDNIGIFRGYNATIHALRAEVKILRIRITRNLEGEDEECNTECVSERIDDEADDDYDEEEQNQNELDSREDVVDEREAIARTRKESWHK